MKKKCAMMIMNPLFDPEKHYARLDHAQMENHIITVRTPEEAVARAKELAEELSDADITVRSREIAHSKSAPAKKAVHLDEVDLEQMTLFDTVKEDDILKELQELELAAMTPIDALNTLYRLQNTLKNRWQSTGGQTCGKQGQNNS